MDESSSNLLVKNSHCHTFRRNSLAACRVSYSIKARNSLAACRVPYSIKVPYADWWRRRGAAAKCKKLGLVPARGKSRRSIARKPKGCAWKLVTTQPSDDNAYCKQYTAAVHYFVLLLSPSSMPPLDRQPTHTSIHSWWSDSNPGLQGPTMNIHAVTKPLMKLMYHQQAQRFIQRDSGAPLSNVALEAYSTYLTYKYVAASTKAMVLKHLIQKAEGESDAQAIVDSPVYPQIPWLLESSDAEIRLQSWNLVGNLALHERSMPAVLMVNPFERIVSLFHNGDDLVIHAAICALARLAWWPEGAQAVITEIPLAHLSKLLESSDADIRERSRTLVVNLAMHETSMPAILGMNPIQRMVSLLYSHNGNYAVIHKATYALANVARWPQGAQAVITANALADLSNLLESSYAGIRESTCFLVGNLAMYETSMPAILAVNPCEKIVSLLHDGHDRVIHAAIYALAKLARWPEGAQAVISANALAHLFKLLKSCNPGIQRQSCTLVGSLACHDTSMSAISAVSPFERMVSILHDGSDSVTHWATYGLVNLAQWPEVMEMIWLSMGAAYALAKLAQWPKGAQAVITANALAHLSNLLESPDADIQMWSCTLGGNLAIHETSMPAILAVNPCEKFVSLLYDGHDQIIHAAIYALAKLARWPEGAQAVITANALAHLSNLLESPDADIQMWSCTLGGNLAIHETSMPAILAVNPCEKFVTLLHDGHGQVIDAAIYALSKLARWPEGAQAVVTANALTHVSELRKSSNADIQRWSCNLAGNLVIYENSMTAILAVNPCEKIVSLLYDRHDQVIHAAIYTLVKLASWPDGAQAVITANALAHLYNLLESTYADIRESSCSLVGYLAIYETSMPAILAISDGHDRFIRAAIYALAKLAQWPEGAQAVITSNALAHLSNLLESPDADIQMWSCTLGGNLAIHETSMPAILTVNPCEKFVSLLQYVSNIDTFNIHHPDPKLAMVMIRLLMQQYTH
ncbi:armadillo-type protein [Mycena pura]|uniref:Vacuolar protein 8 n=1 Tax=Mycena pura TaxID=153505 RepID=A0AAD6VG85_9AGAR|nr:armadillo-type protein [Mycena pura]